MASVRCPHCGSEKVTYLENARLYRCYGDHPKQKFSLKVGTVFEDSPIPLEKWLPAVWLLVNCKNGISSYEFTALWGHPEVRMVHAAPHSPRHARSPARFEDWAATAAKSKWMRPSSAAKRGTCTYERKRPL